MQWLCEIKVKLFELSDQKDVRRSQCEAFKHNKSGRLFNMLWQHYDVVLFRATQCIDLLFSLKYPCAQSTDWTQCLVKIMF